MDAAVTVLIGDARETLKTLESGSVQCCVTSPPYYSLRDYGVDGQIGLEPTPDAYVASLVDVFRELKRVLADDGVFWLNIGDSYSSGNRKTQCDPSGFTGQPSKTSGGAMRVPPIAGIKPKDLLMIPARLALALQADGWYLRSHCIWAKPNPMPESVRDRPTSAHESVFLLTKRARYFYDEGAVREPAVCTARPETSRHKPTHKSANYGNGHKGGTLGFNQPEKGRNMRNVWSITSRPYKGAHFATFPPELAARCVKAGSRPGDIVIDPFFGAGTVGLVGSQLGRSVIGIELNAEYAALAEQRIADDTIRRSQPRKPAAPKATKPAPLGGLFSADEEAVCAAEAKPA